MKDDSPKNQPEITVAKNVREISIVQEMEKSYLDYAMSVIVERALPDVRDGLKPVQRRILFAMHQMGLTPGGKYVKSAKVIGEVLGKYHPHGDSSVYMAAVRMAQGFSLRYLLVDGQGNFGSIDGDPPAAMRYTEMRLARTSQDLLNDIRKNTVNTSSNFDDSLQEPTVLPARIPNLLLNGADGIAVGFATKIPPHNLQELCQAINHILENSSLEQVENNNLPNLALPLDKLSTREKILFDLNQYRHHHFKFETTVTPEDLAAFVKGPDFPTAGIIYGKKSILEIYQTGRGKVIVRGKAEIQENKSGRFQIIISQLPYQVNKSELVAKIADLAKDKKIIGISDLRDESDRQGIRVVVDLKKASQPKSILNKLYKYTQLQTSYPANIVTLVDGVPLTINLRQALLLFLKHREEIIRRRTIFDLEEAKMRAHILEGLKIALDNLDEVIETIKRSPDADQAKENLIKRFGLSDLQAVAILDMQLRRLAALERQKVEDEYKEIQKTITNLISILTRPEKLLKILKNENQEIMERYPDKRRTRIVSQELNSLSEEDLIPEKDVIITVTHTGYIKRVPRDTYRSQKRGGKGVVGMTTKEEDEIAHLLSANTHDYLLFFTNKGRCFRLRAWEIPDSSRQAKGQAIINLINIDQGEEIQTILPVKKDSPYLFVVLATIKGVVKKTELVKYKNIRQNGLIAIRLDPSDELAWARLTSGSQQIFLVSRNGKCIRFAESDIRPMGRHSRGVRGISLKEGNEVINMSAIPAKLPPPKDRRHKIFRHLLVATQRGIGKRTDVYSYPLQKRGGVGVKVANLTKKTGEVACASIVSEKTTQIILSTRKAMTVKLPVKNIPVLGRATQGVILMRPKEGDHITALACLKKQI